VCVCVSYYILNQLTWFEDLSADSIADIVTSHSYLSFLTYDQ